MPNRRPYPTDVSDEEWAFVAPYLALVRQDAPQRTHDLREVFDALRWTVRAGAPWRMLPHDFPPSFSVSRARNSISNPFVDRVVHGEIGAAA